ncbi:MAG: DMT family transporter [Planctomycetes bacterium]|nr:DMT family transporter [Planctomycetota bacterium]
MNSAPTPQQQLARPKWAWPLLLCGAMAVSTGALFIRFSDPAPPMAKAAWRCGLAAIFLLMIGRRRALRPLVKLPRRQQRRLVLAGFFLAVHFATWILSLSHTSVASSLFLVNTVPIWTALIAPFVIAEATRRNQWIGSLICMFGTGILGWGEFSLSDNALFGDLLALAGAISLAMFLILGRELQKAIPGLSYLIATYGSAALFLIAGCLLLNYPLAGYPTPTYFWLFLLALIPQMLGHSAYNISLRHFSAATVSIALVGEPVMGTFLAWLFLSEMLTATTLIGGGILLVGIIVATAKE